MQLNQNKLIKMRCSVQTLQEIQVLFVCQHQFNQVRNIKIQISCRMMYVYSKHHKMMKLCKQQQQFEPSHENAEDQFTETNLIQQEMVEHSCSCSNKVVTPTLNPSPNEQLFEALESAVLQTQFLDKLKAVQSQEDDFVFLESEMEADYIMIGQYEVIQAMSMYIAEYLYTLPEAKKMCPEDLHMALRKAFQELKKNHWKAVWNLGSNLYKGVQFACGTALMLENPWLVRALGVFLWIFAKLLWYVPFALV
eukprot:TRINITY_DN21527_c0_g3_i1.p1 TRINITY_DN21527_c0_g3~~TRINITY_DN21527_c0_g3_i1.p1  ORF type:complete len:251 (+),score=33.18 TRINITY_DN21527_c0_g3_i1:144-896(+)